MAKPDFKQISPFKVSPEEVTSYAKERNIPTMEFPKKSKPVAVKVVELARATSKKYTIDFPDEVMRQLKRRSFEKERTIRSIVLEALSQYGIEVRPEDMVEDGRKRAKAKEL
jgi:hypothetical protein